MTPLIFQTTADLFVDAVINHPDVRPTIQKGTERLSSLELLKDPGTICLGGEGGVAIFLNNRGPKHYEGHVALLPSARGAAGLAFGKAALTRLFTEHGALSVLAPVSVALPAPRWYVRRLGFVSRGRDETGLEERFLLEVSSWVQ